MSNAETLRMLLESGDLRLQPSPFLESVPARHTLDVWPKVEGMLLGLAIGDALGSPSESMLPGRRRQRFGEIRDYLPDPGCPGGVRAFPSDDTQLAFWTLEQLLKDDGLVPENLARAFTGRTIYGLGSTVRRFLANHAAGLPWQECGVASAGNGSLMRIAPMLVPHLRDPSAELWGDVALSAALTHDDPAATATCLAFVALLWELLDRTEPPEPEWWPRRFCEIAGPLEGDTDHRPRGGDFVGYQGPLTRFTEQVLEQAWSRDEEVLEATQRWYSGAYLLETVPSVLYILMRHGDDPEEAIVRAVNDTKDNDTVAAIVGAAVGALHGRDALPASWLDRLPGRTQERDDGRVFDLIEQARERWAPI